MQIITMGQSTSSISSSAAAPGISSTPGSVTQTSASFQSVSHLTTSTTSTSQTASGSASSITNTAVTSGTGTSIPNSGPSHSTTSPALSNLADAATTQLRENFESLHHQLMQHAGADYDIATTTTLSYTQFLSYISRLNEICRLYQDDDGRVLVFAVKKGTDSSIFWKATVRIACVKYHMSSRTMESQRLLNIRQFLQVFRRISYECTDGGLGAPPSSPHNTGRLDERPIAPTTAAAAVLRELPSTPRHSDGAGKDGRARSDSELEECVICLERRPDVILPCAHAYCLPCIQQWWEYRDGPPTQWQCTLREVVNSGSSSGESERTCPVCREAVSDADDTWVISEAPDDALVTHEISKALMGIAGSSARGSGGINHLAHRPDNN